MKLSVYENGVQKMSIPVPMFAVIRIVRGAMKQRAEIPSETVRQFRRFYRRVRPMLKAYQGLRLVEMRGKDGSELVITL